MVEILLGLGKRECTKEAEDMGRLDMVNTNHFDCMVGHGGTNHVDCCHHHVAVLMPIQAIASNIAQSLQLLPSMDLKWSLDSASRNSSMKDCYTIWFALMQSHQIIQQFYFWHSWLPLVSETKCQRKLSFVSFGI
jgi:hypothetical protein